MMQNRDNIPSPEGYTEDNIKDFVTSLLGEDILFPRGYQILVLLWKPSERDEDGFYRTDQEIKAETRGELKGRILRFGEDAFTDEMRFPSGPLVSIGEWAIFREGGHMKMRVNGYDVAFINDDRFLGVTSKPERIQTRFDSHHEYTGV